MAKLSKVTIANITQAIYGAAYAMHSWGRESAEHRFSQMTKSSVTEYYYRNYMLDLIQVAEVREGDALHPVGKRLYPVTIGQLVATMATSVLHHQSIQNNRASISVKQLEQLLVAKLRPIESYIEIFLGEYDDVIFSCRRRELVIRVKPEYAAQAGLSLRHTLLDKDLRESKDSRRVRAERSLFTENAN